jgi:hypothetical protein
LLYRVRGRFLRSVSDADGENVHRLDPYVLDEVLSQSVAIPRLVSLIPDGSDLDVSKVVYDAFIEEHGTISDEELAEVAARTVGRRSMLIALT